MSVIIPAWRDRQEVSTLLRAWRHAPSSEVIVAPSLEELPHYEPLQREHGWVKWIGAPRGRASQMNAGASVARGEWLLFLHADSQLPASWADEISKVAATPGVVGGAFRFAIDSRDRRARILEFGVSLRVAVFGLPYGDQALFARRSVFDAIGGYRDLPLMEDVDFVRRLKRAGPLLYSPARVLTSARRWERDGWFSRSARNVVLATRFLLGTSPATLARTYFGRRRVAIVMMARAPWVQGKTRVARVVDPTAHAELRDALFADVLAVLCAVGGAERLIACEPAEAAAQMQDRVGTGIDVIAQRGDTLGERLANAIVDTRRLGCESVIVFGSDLPDLPAQTLARARAILRRGGRDDIVIGPAADGGYYLIGLNAPHVALFEQIDWSTPRVLTQTLERAGQLRLKPHLLEIRRDVDEADDLFLLLESANAAAAPHTRSWAARHGVGRSRT